MTDAVVFKNVDIIFGNKPEAAIAMVDQGKTRDEIGAATGLVLGVADASLTITEGEILVLMGLSGSGKSTLLRAVNGLAPVVRGEVQVKTRHGNINPYKTSAKSLRDFRMHDVSMVFQQFALAALAHGGRQCRLRAGACRRTGQGTQGPRCRTAGTGQPDEMGRPQVKELSGGMQQRVGLARAFATGAPILLMDEPFSALDPLIRTRLQDELLEFQRRLKKTILFVSHDLDEAFRIGNRIAIMEGGRIIQCGTPQDIVKNPANQYVADFVQHMNPITMLTAMDVMSQGVSRNEGPVGVSATAKPTTPLIDILDAMSRQPGSIGVVDNGAIIGTINAQNVVEGLTRHRNKS
jgi:glycine betaine/proline transport system ATP-binding protein